MSSTIFIIDSSPAVRRMVEQLSASEECEILGFQDGPTALEAARTMSPHLIIADYHLDQMTFTGFCKEICKLDHLTETDIVSLISPSDHVDDAHLRSLGVKASLTKPFQPEHLLEVIKDLKEQQTTKANGAKKTLRSWPPVSQATDSGADADRADSPTGTKEDRALAPHPQPKDSPVTITSTAASAIEPEDMMKGLFSQLLQSMSERTEKKITELLPQMVGKDLAALVAKAVEAEVRTQTSASLPEERLTSALEPLLLQALPKALEQKIALLEPIIQRSLADIAGPLIQARLEQFVAEQTAALRATLPDMVREQLGSIEELVKEEIRQTSAKQTAGMVEELVRAAAREQIEEAVQRLVPGLAEAQIKAELTRLTAAA